MNENSILSSAPIVRALLDGRKTQTRRVVKGGYQSLQEREAGAIWPWREDLERVDGYWSQCPYGDPGDRLWVRETWAQPTTLGPGPTFYRADYPACVPPESENVPPADAIRWKPSIHMPRWASQILLEVTSVRVERLQDISEDDL